MDAPLTHNALILSITSRQKWKKERAPVENVSSNLYESVCIPDFDEFFQGSTGYSSSGGERQRLQTLARHELRRRRPQLQRILPLSGW